MEFCCVPKARHKWAKEHIKNNIGEKEKTMDFANLKPVFVRTSISLPKSKYLNMIKAYKKYITRSGMMIRGDVISILANRFSFFRFNKNKNKIAFSNDTDYL